MQSPEQRPPVGDRSSRILIADDEVNIARTLKEILANEGFPTMAVFGGRAAVQMAVEWRPDLLIADVFMPDLNGIEAAIQITQVLPSCRILLFSGNAVVYDLTRDARERGYDFSILLKPIHPLELLREVDAALRGDPL